MVAATVQTVMSKNQTPHRRKQQLLAAVLMQVPEHGWSEAALAKASNTAGLSDAEAERLFPDGVADVIAFFHEVLNDHMRTVMDAHSSGVTMRTRDKVALGVRARLDYLTPHRKAVERLLSWSLSPAALRDSGKYLWQAADAIWLAAGDTSGDYNRYTKRLMLMGVMKATLSKWLKDTSPGCADTWAFLARRVDDIVSMGQTIGKLGSFGRAR